MKSKMKIITVLAIIMFAILIIPNKSKAVLQSNGGTPVNYVIKTMISNIRRMEGAGGALRT